MAKAMTKLLSAPATEPITLVTTLRQRIRQPIALLQQLVGPGQLLGTLTQPLDRLRQRIGQRVGLLGDARRHQPAPAAQAQQQDHKECGHRSLVGQRAVPAQPAAHAVDQHAEQDGREQQQEKVEGQPGDDAQQHHGGQDGRLHHGAVGDLLVVVRRCWLGHASPPDEYKGYDRPRGALIQAFR